MFDVAASRGRVMLFLREAGAWGLDGLSSASLPLFFSGSPGCRVLLPLLFSGSPGFRVLFFADAAGASGLVNREKTMTVF